jgi:hypothetical protein
MSGFPAFFVGYLINSFLLPPPPESKTKVTKLYLMMEDSGFEKRGRFSLEKCALFGRHRAFLK